MKCTVNKKRWTYKTRGVVIPHSLGITISLKQRVGSNNLILKRALHWLKGVLIIIIIISSKYLYSYIVSYLNFAVLFLLVTSNRNCGKVLNDTFGVHSLSSTGFSTGTLKMRRQTLIKYINFRRQKYTVYLYSILYISPFIYICHISTLNFHLLP